MKKMVCDHCGKDFAFPEYVEKLERNVRRLIPVCPHYKKNLNEKSLQKRCLQLLG